MTKTEYREYITSPQWKARRKEFLKPYSFCLHCWMPRWLAIIAYDQDLHVHHRSYKNLGHESPLDLEPLCRRCHEVETFGRSDLVAPPSHRCSSCDADHWNRYSDDCDRCISAKLGSNGLSDKLLLSRSFPEVCHVWSDILSEIITVVGLDAVMEHMAKGEGVFRENHDWHLQVCAERKAKLAEKNS